MLGKLTAPESGELRLYDTKVPGLLLRWRKGAPSPRWYILKRVRDRTVQSALGELSSWPAVPVVKARELATRALAELASGKSPADIRTEAKQARAAKKTAMVPMLEVWKRHKAILEERGRTDGHIREIQLLAEQSAAAGVDDFRRPDIAARAEKWLMGQDIAQATRRRRRGHFKDLGTTAMRWWGLTVNPFAPLEMTKPVVADVELFTLPECIALVSDEGLKHEWGMLGALLLYHGLRLREGIWLHRDHIDEVSGVFHVVPPTAKERAAGHAVKRNKTREVPLQEEFAPLLKRLTDQSDGYLFPAEFRIRSRKWHWDRFHGWCRSVGIESGTRHPHTLRHQRATVGLASNEGELRLQLALGHAGAIMTAHYAQKAMRWRKAVGHWRGVIKFRDPAEVAKLVPASGAEQAS
jgi:integrase